jgi:AcrR family transcriptional regulator
MSTTEPDPPPRRRLARDARLRQLLDAAWRVVREEGTEALTLGRLAEQSGVTKPVVYDHFGTRSGLLAALYQEFDARQTAIMDARPAKRPWPVGPQSSPRPMSTACCCRDARSPG